MGYNSRVTGILTIKPALSDKAVEELGLEEDGQVQIDLVAERCGEEEDVALVNGVITVVPGNSWTEVIPRYEDEYKAYHLGENIEAVVARARTEGCLTNGLIYVAGEEDGDYSRYRIEDNAIEHEHPEFLWPNGDKGLP